MEVKWNMITNSQTIGMLYIMPNTIVVKTGLWGQTWENDMKHSFKRNLLRTISDLKSGTIYHVNGKLWMITNKKTNNGTYVMVVSLETGTVEDLPGHYTREVIQSNQIIEIWNEE